MKGSHGDINHFSKIRIVSGTQNKIKFTFGPTFFISDFVLRIFFFIFLITTKTGIKG